MNTLFPRRFPVLFPVRLAAALCAVALGAAGFVPPACAQVYENIYSFAAARATDQGNTPNKGSVPVADLVQGSDGSFYGTTSGGGADGVGTVFKMTPAGVLTTLVEFTGDGASNKGAYPFAGLVPGSDGNFYGTTALGGASDSGTVFKMTLAGVLTTLVEFTGNGASNKGAQPRADLIQGSDGNFYGTTLTGGATGFGTVFKMTPAGVLTTLVEFTGNGATDKGRNPQAGLVQGSDGSFYGTTSQGGAIGFGTIFKMTPAGVLTTLVEFTGNGATNKGRNPQAGLVQGSDGSFYGTTQSGSAGGVGTVFKMTPAGVLTTLVVFTGDGASNRGSQPQAGLVQGSDGRFYGTTIFGGVNGVGTVFKMTPAGVLTTLVEFTGSGTSSKGSSPAADLVLGSDGSFYGTTFRGGANNAGTVFKMTPAGVLTTLVEFTGNGASNNGSSPLAGLVQGSDGTFYGTTLEGGSNSGTVFKMTPDGVLTTLVVFSGNGASNKGAHPRAGLVQGSDGDFYGTTSEGGAASFGTVFKMTPDGVLTTLVEFTGNGASNKGSYSYAGLVQGSDGSFYGTTSEGGTAGFGTVFKMTPAGVLTTLVVFTGDGASNKGSYPYAGLVQGSDGSFYGMTGFGGAADRGTVFKMTPAGVLTTLVEFTDNGASNKGAQPRSGLVQGSDGSFYGTTSEGGTNGVGTVFKMTSAGVLTTLVEFTIPEEGNPTAGLIPGADGNLYGTTAGPDGSIYRLLFPGAPLVFANAAALGSFSAVVDATVNARGAATAVALEYGTDGVNFPNIVPVATNLTGYQSRLVGTTLEALTPNTRYYYRFRAVSSAGTSVSQVANFLTTLSAPTATVSAPSSVLATSARFQGLVNARGYATTVIFEWGLDGQGFPNQVAATPSPLTGASEVPVSATVTGLVQGTAYRYRIVATNTEGTVVSATQSFSTLAQPVAVVGAATAVTDQSARLHGTVEARGTLTAVVFEYGTVPGTYSNTVVAMPATVSGNSPVPVTVNVSGLTPGVTYYYRVKATSAGGVGVSAELPLELDLLSQFAQTFPETPPEALGFVVIDLSPAGIAAGWRFAGEQAWRPSGALAGSLTTGDRTVEFRPVPGYLQPPSENVSVISGGAPVFWSRTYTPTGAVGSGTLTVVLKPDDVADVNMAQAVRAQWRFLGEGDPTDPDDNQSATWRNSGETITGLLAGNYLVECKPVVGRATPPPLNVPLLDGQTVAKTATYIPASTPTGTPPGVLPFETVTASPNLPYGYVGQLRSNVGVGTGFAVRVDPARTGGARVVATAGQVIFDDGALAFATGLQWLFQRDAGAFEPKPLIPRGSYVFDGYAARRTAEAMPGNFSPQSQHLDAGAIYFLEDAARGGFGGYLASDAPDNPFLLSPALKTLVGYPLDGIDAENQGRMHATPVANIHFARVPGTTTVLDPPAPASPYPDGTPFRLYATSEIHSSGGNSGGPLCVQFDDGTYYPAGIFLGGAGQTVVRSIDSELIALFRRAEDSGYDEDPNNTGGGIVQINTPIGGGGFSLASLVVDISPASAVNGGARWRLGTNGTAYTGGTQLTGLTPANYNLVLTAVPGFITPATTSRTLTAGVLSTISVPYNGFTTHPANRTIFAFQDTTFSVAVSGTPNSYQWRFRPPVGATVLIPGATSSSYTLSNADNSDEGEYAVAVTWPNGVILSSFATLTVNPTAQVITFPQPPNRILDDGSFILDAPASSGLAVAFQILSGPATIAGATLTPTGLGTVTVRASQPGSGNYSAAANKIQSFDVLGDNLNAWRTRRFTAAELGNPLISGSLADFDGDGVNTLLEFSLNLDPKLGDRITMTAVTGTRGLPLIRSENVSGQQRLTAEFVRRRAAGSPGIAYSVEFNSVLTNPNGWTTGSTEVVTPIDTTWERVKVTDPQPASTTRYGRLKVTMP